MVSFEKGSKVVMSLGSADPAFVNRGEQNFARFASVLDGCAATCKVRSTPLPFLLGGLSILRHIVVARFDGSQPSPFFDAKGPVRKPIVLTAAQREALGANRSRPANSTP